MVKIRENPIKMDDLGGFRPIFGNTHLVGGFSCLFFIHLCLGKMSTLTDVQPPTSQLKLSRKRVLDSLC